MSYSLVDAILRKRMDLLPTTKQVLCVYASFANDATHLAYPSVEEVAELVNVSERQVRTHISTLVEKGFLVDKGGRRGGKGKTTMYLVAAETRKCTSAFEDGADASDGDVEPSPSLLSLSADAVADMTKSDLVQRFCREFDAFADPYGVAYGERIKGKASTAKTSPTGLLAKCILENYLPEIRQMASQPPAAAEKKPRASRRYPEYVGD